MIANPPAVDPITLEVIRHGLVSITNQIDANMTRTAFSPYIYEYRDYAVGFVGLRGELIAQSVGGMPIFVADSVGAAVRDGLAMFGADGQMVAQSWDHPGHVLPLPWGVRCALEDFKDDLHPGDAILLNDPYRGGTHLNDVTLLCPVFDEAG